MNGDRPVSYSDLEDLGIVVDGAELVADGGLLRLTIYKDDGTQIVIGGIIPDEEDEQEW
jgi:hypothetical protein